MRPVLFIVAIAIILGSVGYGVFTISINYLASQEKTEVSPVETNTSYKKYSNQELSFTLAYPPQWRLVDNPDKDKGGTTQFFSYPEDKYIGGETMDQNDTKIEIAYLNNPENLSIEEFAIITTDTNAPPGDHEHTHEVVHVGGIPYVRCTEEGETYATFYTETKNGTVLSISVYPYVIGSEADNILSSLRLE